MVSEPVAPSLSHTWTPPNVRPPQAVAGSTGLGAPMHRTAPVQRSNPAADPAPLGEMPRQVSVVQPPSPTPRPVLDSPHMSADGPLVGAPIPSPTTPVDGASVQRTTAPATSIAAWRTHATPVQRVPGRSLDQETGPSTPPQPIRTMSLQQMFEQVQEPSPMADPSTPGAGAPAAVQRDSVPSGPAASTTAAPPGPVTAAAAGVGAGSGSGNTDELATRLYEPLVARIKAELWLDRERAGVLTDPRY
jgi:hypothetical protein